MRDDAGSDVDGEIIGGVARASLRHEEKVPGPIVRRTGLCNRYEGDQATHGHRRCEEVFHYVLHCFRHSLRRCLTQFADLGWFRSTIRASPTEEPPSPSDSAVAHQALKEAAGPREGKGPAPG